MRSLFTERSFQATAFSETVATGTNDPLLILRSTRKPVSVEEESVQFTVILQYGASCLSHEMFVRNAFDGGAGGPDGGGGGGGGAPQSTPHEYVDSPSSQIPLPHLGDGALDPLGSDEGRGAQSLEQEELDSPLSQRLLPQTGPGGGVGQEDTSPSQFSSVLLPQISEIGVIAPSQTLQLLPKHL